MERLKSHPESVKKLLLDHVVLGQRLDLGIGADLSFTTLGGRTVQIKSKPGGLVANGANVATDKVDVGIGRLIIIDNYLFPEDLTADHSFVQDMTQVLSLLQSGVRVFQHLLARSNVTKLLKKEDDYTVLVPTDRAFQRWHPIDWGFYPFSVPEFTEMVLMNHFIKGSIKQETLVGSNTVTSLGGRQITFAKTNDGMITANGVELVKGDTPINKGNIMFVTEVLFVDEQVVSQLHEEHRDKETPPLLAFPWFGSQFLSHAFVALEADARFKHVTRFLNQADLAFYVSGAGYTFFVPTDAAFNQLRLENAPDNVLASSDKGMSVLLSHFVKTRLYDKDIKDGATFTSLSNRTLHITRKPGLNGTVEGADIIEKEVFVYNLGTMFFVNRVIFGDEIPCDFNSSVVTTVGPSREMTTSLAEEIDATTVPDILLEESTVPTTTTVPVSPAATSEFTPSVISSKKK
ncbi:hypothetical protein GE061_009766 [Apolygus lucorum]|uniref:FAS1 domain-containing protein n=1 Tax=Apolygus lucorum TaxID=248454 RepID=A0A6A4K3Q5_APOLU|nr:hypothetical protein GE061_009766 [Apolygus lucorum]